MSNINSLFSGMYEYIETKKEYFDLFIDLDTRYEGWLEAEIMKYISNKPDEFHIEKTKKNHEVYGRPDLILKANGETWIIELKAFLINRRSLRFYLKGRGGARKDFARLKRFNKNFWIIICLACCEELNSENFENNVEEVSKKYNIKILNTLTFYTPKNKQVTLMLWGK